MTAAAKLCLRSYLREILPQFHKPRKPFGNGLLTLSCPTGSSPLVSSRVLP
jgi:hypothetical protein